MSENVFNASYLCAVCMFGSMYVDLSRLVLAKKKQQQQRQQYSLWAFLLYIYTSLVHITTTSSSILDYVRTSHHHQSHAWIIHSYQIVFRSFSIKCSLCVYTTVTKNTLFSSWAYVYRREPLIIPIPNHNNHNDNVIKCTNCMENLWIILSVIINRWLLFLYLLRTVAII